MTVKDLVYKSVSGVDIKVVDINNGNEIIKGTGGYIMNYPDVLMKKVVIIDIEKNEMIIRV